MKLWVASAAAIAAPLIGSGVARAEDALQTLEGMQMTAPMDWPTIPQDGPKADAIRQILKEKIKLPPGFHIELYALVPDARHMAVGPQGVVTFVGTRKSKIWAVTDRSRTGAGAASRSRNSRRAAKEVAERPLLLERRFPLCGRAEPGPAICGGRVLLRGPGRRGWRRGSGGRIDSQVGRKLQPHRARMPRRA